MLIISPRKEKHNRNYYHDYKPAVIVVSVAAGIATVTAAVVVIE